MTFVFVGLGALFAAGLQSSTGLGFALVLTPIALALQAPTAAILLVTVLGLGLSTLVLLGEQRRPRIAWEEVKPILIAAIPGAVCGLIVLQALPKPPLQVGVGALVVAAALIHAGNRRARRGQLAKSQSARAAVGFITGVLTTATGVSGPPLALWLTRRGLAASQIRDTLSALFFIIGVVALGLLLTRSANLDPWLLVAGLGCVAAGHALGSRAFVRLEAHTFEPLLVLVIMCAGIASIVSGAASF